MDQDTLLKTWGFEAHPFRESVAEKESKLSSVFLEPPYFREILRDITSPSSNIVFGGRGDGKSATCNMLHRELLSNKSNRVLAVKYTDLPEYTETASENPSLELHLHRILGLCVEELVKCAEQDISVVGHFDPETLGSFQWFVLRFLPAANLREVEKRLVTLLDKLPKTRGFKRLSGRGYRSLASLLRQKKTELDEAAVQNQSRSFGFIRGILALVSSPIPGTEPLRNLSLVRLFERFKDLIMLAGFASIYVLVDRVDERAPFNVNYQLLAKLIMPLVSSVEYLEIPNVGTKLFLPRAIREFLGKETRTDRFRTFDITWPEERLAAMLRKRLLAFSNGTIDTLGSFVVPSLWGTFKKNLFLYAAASPRNLLRILYCIMTELCELEENPKLINKTAMDFGIRHFYGLRTGEFDASEYQSRLSESDTETSQLQDSQESKRRGPPRKSKSSKK